MLNRSLHSQGWRFCWVMRSALIHETSYKQRERADQDILSGCCVILDVGICDGGRTLGESERWRNTAVVWIATGQRVCCCSSILFNQRLLWYIRKLEIYTDAMTEPRTVCWSNPTSHREVVELAAEAAPIRAKAVSVDLSIVLLFLPIFQMNEWWRY